MSKGVIHEIAHRSFWSGRVRALCGYVAESGTYDTALFGFWSGTRCPHCQRIKNNQRKGTR